MKPNKEDMDDHDKDVINAAKHCRTEHANGLEDNDEWADSIKGHNAFGKCVSWHARHKHSSSS